MSSNIHFIAKFYGEKNTSCAVELFVAVRMFNSLSCLLAGLLKRRKVSGLDAKLTYSIQDPRPKIHSRPSLPTSC